jgi:hypothetical protein
MEPSWNGDSKVATYKYQWLLGGCFMFSGQGSTLFETTWPGERSRHFPSDHLSEGTSTTNVGVGVSSRELINGYTPKVKALNARKLGMVHSWAYHFLNSDLYISRPSTYPAFTRCCEYFWGQGILMCIYICIFMCIYICIYVRIQIWYIYKVWFIYPFYMHVCTMYI